ncbi:MAG: pyridoxal 5'-phosphate synthase glutaminase subunit PdxT [Thermoplasmata archaeon]|jgi:5'-phosphate synthase pdxT subunit
MKVGVLGLQGDVPEHLRAIAAADPKATLVTVRAPADLESLDALFLPGGESTTMARLLNLSGLWTPLREALAGGLPVLATCAGLILLSDRLEPTVGAPDPPTLGGIDVTVKRNDYGRQRESFESPVRLPALGIESFPGVFIRAPRIRRVGAAAEPIAWQGSEVVGLRQGPRWGLTFHPELSDDPRITRAFLAAARDRSQ